MKAWLRLLALLVATHPVIASAAVDEADLLPVDQAFALSASAPSRDAIAVRWAIADGYYLYRHRISVQVEGDGFVAEPLQLPAGKAHEDAYFGRVETYRTALQGTLPGVAAPGASAVTLRIKYQGCADAGVCYPPQTRTLVVQLPVDGSAVAPSGDAASGSPGNAGFAALGRQLGGGGAPTLALPGTSISLAGAPLPPDRAFGFEAIAGDGNTLLLRFTPAKGYYLYRDHTTLQVQTPDGAVDASVTPLAPRWPAGVAHSDEHFGQVTVFFDGIDVPLPLRRSDAAARDIDLVATFQGCQTDGICYPPMTRTVRVALPAATVVATAATSTTAHATPAPAIEQAEDSRLAAALSGPNRLWTLLVFFAFGLGLAFTPCVWPMIPILSGLIAGAGTRMGSRRALWLSFVYVLSNALVFTVAGIVAGLLGTNLQAAFQAPGLIIAFALLFVVLAASSFGAFELQLPAGLRARLGSMSDRQRGGSVWGVAAMGVLSALIVGPCVAPPLAAAVLYIGQTHDPVFGGAALFLLAMGMGVPLLAFGAAAGRGMPTSGPWMIAAQRVFGFVFLALAVWMLSRILPGPVVLALYGVVALAAAVWCYMQRDLSGSPRVHASALFAALLLGVFGVAQLFGAMAGGSDPLQPLAGLRAGEAGRGEAKLSFQPIKSVEDLDRALVAAQGRDVLFDFYADWCVACKEMDKYTFTAPTVRAALADTVLLKADVTANDAVDQALMQRFGIIGPPGTLFFRDARELRALRLVGFEAAAPFVARIARAQSPVQGPASTQASAQAQDPAGPQALGESP